MILIFVFVYIFSLVYFVCCLCIDRPGGAPGLPAGSYHSPPCTASKCSQHYHSQDQTPSYNVTGARNECTASECDCGKVPCGEYLWDHRNASLRRWLVDEHVLGPNGLGNANVTGFYFDDNWKGIGFPWTDVGMPFNASNCATGPSEIESHCLLDMGLDASDVDAIAAGWKQTMREVTMAVVEGGGWSWPQFTELDVTPAPSTAACAARYRESCAKLEPRMTMSIMHLKSSNAPGSFVDAKADVAQFLLMRGPYAYLGTGWVGCEPDNGPDGGGSNQTYVRSPWFDRDYGEPLGLCAERAPNVFAREWSKATVAHDCNSGESTIIMK